MKRGSQVAISQHFYYLIPNCLKVSQKTSVCIFKALVIYYDLILRSDNCSLSNLILFIFLCGFSKEKPPNCMTLTLTKPGCMPDPSTQSTSSNSRISGLVKTMLPSRNSCFMNQMSTRFITIILHSHKLLIQKLILLKG